MAVRCAFCRRGTIGFRPIELSVREMTDRGWVECQVRVVVGRCDTCDQMHLDESQDTAINTAVKRARDALTGP